MEEKTRVDFVIDFQFKSHLLDHVANEMFYQAATRMMSAFESCAPGPHDEAARGAAPARLTVEYLNCIVGLGLALPTNDGTGVPLSAGQ